MRVRRSPDSPGGAGRAARGATVERRRSAVESVRLILFFYSRPALGHMRETRRGLVSGSAASRPPAHSASVPLLVLLSGCLQLLPSRRTSILHWETRYIATMFMRDRYVAAMFSCRTERGPPL